VAAPWRCRAPDSASATDFRGGPDRVGRHAPSSPRSIERGWLETLDNTAMNQKIPMRWWDKAPNFGDLLSPWLAGKISGKETFRARPDEAHYLAIGSILEKTLPTSTVWGSGAFGTETRAEVCATARYLAVRGPLTRNKLETFGIRCPRVYGDPALLLPEFHNPHTDKKYETGIVLRWSETRWVDELNLEGVKKIYLGSTEIESVLDDMIACKRIVSSSLHGLIIADAYGIPNAWLSSASPKGKEFKFFDYFISVEKLRTPQSYALLRRGVEHLAFDDRPIRIDLDPLKECCPFGFGGAANQ
jgi:pyruvyltransferase